MRPTNRPYQSLGRWLFITFLLWHMAAVWFVSIPFHASDPISPWLRRHLVPIVEPYIFATSQWQRWWVFVRERPPTEILYFIQHLDERGHELALLPVSSATLTNLAPSCLAGNKRPFGVRLIRRSYLGIDQNLPARSPRFAPRGWEQTIKYQPC